MDARGRLFVRLFVSLLVGLAATFFLVLRWRRERESEDERKALICSGS
jgi:hypothetical protein